MGRREGFEGDRRRGKVLGEGVTKSCSSWEDEERGTIVTALSDPVQGGVCDICMGLELMTSNQKFPIQSLTTSLCTGHREKRPKNTNGQAH